MASGFKYNPSGEFFKRYVQASNTKSEIAKSTEKEEFDKGYKAGTLKFACIDKFMSMRSCGLDRFLDEKTGCIWERNGDQIIRVENDTSWIDNLLDTEGNR